MEFIYPHPNMIAEKDKSIIKLAKASTKLQFNLEIDMLTMGSLVPLTMARILSRRCCNNYSIKKRH